MSNIILFKPRRELTAEQNLADFVSLCRDELTIFGVDLEFDMMSWDISADVKLKGKTNAVRAVFSSWETASNKKPTPLPEPFGAFAKAYFRYQHGFKPTKSIGSRLAAVRALGAALAERGISNVARVDTGTLNRAAQLIRAKFSDAAGYRVSQQLEMLASFLDDNRLAALPLRWSNPLPRPVEVAGRVGKEFEAARQDKLPSPYALDCLARAFRAAAEPSDLVVTAVAGIMCSAPDRVNEVLALRAQCEVRMQRPNGDVAYGLQFWPSKGADPMVKWVIPSMSSVVQEAIKRLDAASIEARAVALWYEKNPSSIFLPSHLEHLRGKDLSMAELGEVLFVETPHRTVPRQWCVDNNVPTEIRGKKLFVRFDEVEAAVLRALPEGFPWLDVERGVRFSEALCVTRRNELHKAKGTYRGIIDALNQGFISTGLGNRSKHGFTSVFENLGFFEADGSPVVIRTHQFRHYLNTLAQAGGMSELDIAKWSGRKDVRQNSVYNHVSDRDLQARLAEIKEEAKKQSSTELTPQVRISLIPREKFKEMGIQAAHTTDFGMCVHDFVMSPCALHQDCINCNEQVCIKGDEFGEANTRAKHEETAHLLREARAAENEQIYGASRWVQHQQLTYERLSELVAILDNPNVPKGAVIRLTHIKPASRLRHAVEARKALGIDVKEQNLLQWTIDESKSSI